MSTTESQQFVAAEHRVEERSGALRKELRLGDLVLSQVLYITGIQWLGTAGKLGSAHIMYWIPAVLLFYIPSGIVIVHLTTEMPLEGGLYQWAKLRFGERAGFLVGLNLWATAVLIIGSVVSTLTDNFGYAMGPSGSWIVESKVITAAITALLMGALTFVTVRGLSIAKWVHNIGGGVLLFLLASMLAFAMPRWVHGSAAVAPVALAIPAVSLLNLNIAAKMGFGAFSGFDGCAIFAGEVRDPNVARIMRRSIYVAGPLIALIYIAGTACVLAFTRPTDLDLISPPTQALARGAQGTLFAPLIGPTAALLLMASVAASASIYFNAAIRLPMVAGWDHLLPAWLSRLHPRFRTPVGSIVAVSIATFALTLFGNFGVHAQEAFQFLNNEGLICWALTYLLMFSIPLLARGEKPPLSVRLSAIAGFVMTLLYVVLSLFPIVAVRNSASYTVRVIAVIFIINGAGALYFRHAAKKRAATSQEI